MGLPCLLLALLSVVASQLACPPFDEQGNTTFSLNAPSAISNCTGFPSGFQVVQVPGLTASYKLWCHKNETYLALKNATNFGETSGAKTSYCAVRVDDSGYVDVTDMTFTTTIVTRELLQPDWTNITTAPLGFAGSCRRGYLATAMIDLTDTPFMLSTGIPFYALSATAPGGSINISTSRQVVSLAGGDYCGFAKAKLSNTDASQRHFDGRLGICEQFGWDLALWPITRRTESQQTSYCASAPPICNGELRPACNRLGRAPRPRVIVPPTPFPTPGQPTPMPSASEILMTAVLTTGAGVTAEMTTAKTSETDLTSAHATVSTTTTTTTPSTESSTESSSALSTTAEPVTAAVTSVVSTEPETVATDTSDVYADSFPDWAVAVTIVGALFLLLVVGITVAAVVRRRRPCDPIPVPRDDVYAPISSMTVDSGYAALPTNAESDGNVNEYEYAVMPSFAGANEDTYVNGPINPDEDEA
jgi:hypothetical protein